MYQKFIYKITDMTTNERALEDNTLRDGALKDMTIKDKAMRDKGPLCTEQ